MKTVKALVAFSNGVISMEQYEVRELPTEMANDLIAAGICAEVGGGSGGGVLVVTDTEGTLDKTWQEIHDAFVSGSVRIQKGDFVYGVNLVGYDQKDGYGVGTGGSGYVATSASDYPVLMG